MQANGLPHPQMTLGKTKNIGIEFEAGFQPAMVIGRHEPRALPWAGMRQGFALLIKAIAWIRVIAVDKSAVASLARWRS